MSEETLKVLNILMVKLLTDQEFSRDKMISDIKRLMVGEPPEALLSEEATLALMQVKQECVTGIHTSKTSGRL